MPALLKIDMNFLLFV